MERLEFSQEDYHSPELIKVDKDKGMMMTTTKKKKKKYKSIHKMHHIPWRKFQWNNLLWKLINPQ
jgi:hypothetical protein